MSETSLKQATWLMEISAIIREVKASALRLSGHDNKVKYHRQWTNIWATLQGMGGETVESSSSPLGISKSRILFLLTGN